MKFLFRDFVFSTKEHIELVDITRQITNIIHVCGINNGVCLIVSPHCTTAIIVNENEKGLICDIIKKIKEEFPRNLDWLHNQIDDNAAAHLASIFLGTSKTFPIRDGDLIRGTWQNIFLLELDGPKKRNVICEIIGELENFKSE